MLNKNALTNTTHTQREREREGGEHRKKKKGESYLLTTRLGLRNQVLLANELSLGLVDVLHQHTLVLELVTLGLNVQALV